ncbi:alpha-beta hydrolase superfamily lysophospholipase [Onishia taeanensis]|uniref:Alpha-beta hydrolase superfamily lysophospholipase n=1 Tax=Onishia taeanensis TaxID=284577 RepID=A0A328XI20_9GAMM|nr:alpha/beta fold hydrolase [Halomonas taeanensis]RAR58625.1 alpha-beta hydrolase superfamily lysophospholipase [Halomonas taeanensis]
MTDFASLQALGPMERTGAPGGPPHAGTLGRYLEHYQLSPLLADQVGLHVGFVEAGNFRLWAQVWSPAEPKGTAFVVHGYFDHLGLYRHLLALLLERGWRVVMWDLPGHGLSSGPRATIEDFDDYGLCLRALQDHLSNRGLAPQPWIGIGQSTGAAILATDALRQGPNSQWAGLALLAPLVRPFGWSQSSWLHLLAGPFLRSLPRRFNPNSTDSDFTTFLKESDPLQPDRLPVSWINAMRRWMPRLLALPPSELPVLILQGEQDLTVDWQWNLEVLRGKFPRAIVHRHPEARHHLVNEAEEIRQSMFAELETFLAQFETSPAVTQEPSV